MYSNQEMHEREQALKNVRSLEDWYSMTGRVPYSARFSTPKSTDRIAQAVHFAKGEQSRTNEGHIMRSRFAGRCATCGGPIAEGGMIRYDGRAHHSPSCPERKSAPIVEAETSESVKLAIREGTYTVVVMDTHRTFRVHTPRQGVLAGKTILQYLSGADNESDYTGFAFVTERGISIWRRFSSDSELVRMARVLLDPTRAEDAGYAYALESSRCYRCGKKLTVPASIHRGLGPICAKGGTD